MLTSITPLGERGRANRYAVTATAYFLGSLAGGAMIGAAFGSVGSLALQSVSTRALIGVLGVAAIVAAVFDAAGRRPPSWHRQVNENWMQRYRGSVYGAGYGLQLGVGVVTIVTTASLYAAAASWVLVASPWGGALLGAVFGLARGVPLLATRGADTPTRLQAVHRRLVAIARPADVLTAVVCVAVAGVAVAVSTGAFG
jgi:hypothetical protein